MEYWAENRNGPFSKIKMSIIQLKPTHLSILPPFHYSIIPLFRLCGAGFSTYEQFFAIKHKNLILNVLRISIPGSRPFL